MAGTLGACLLRNSLAGNGVIRAGEGTIKVGEEKNFYCHFFR